MLAVVERHQSRVSRLAVYLYAFVAVVCASFGGETEAHESTGSDQDGEAMLVGMELDSAKVVKGFHAALKEDRRD